MDNILEKKKGKKASTNKKAVTYNSRSSTYKSKKKPMKVVYISNPMKFKICASKFRDLVQELTGQDAELPDPTKIIVDAADDDDDHEEEDDYDNQTVITTTTTETDNSSRTIFNVDDGFDEDDNSVLEGSLKLDLAAKEVDDDHWDDNLMLEMDFDVDDAFMPPMFENFYDQFISMEFVA